MRIVEGATVFGRKDWCRSGFGWFFLILFLLIETMPSPAATVTNSQVTIVDVLMLYTVQARAGAGSTLAIQQQIQGAMAEANSVFQNSQTHVRLRLAGTALLNKFTESGSLSSDLRNFSSSTSQIFKAINKLKKSRAADLVCVVEETGTDTNFCALPGPASTNGISVILRSALVGTGTFPMALSINFGCQTDREHASNPGAFPF